MDWKPAPDRRMIRTICSGFFFKSKILRYSVSPAGGKSIKNEHQNIRKMKNLTPYLLDATPAITASGVTTIEGINPTIEAIILIISGITALIRLWNASKNPKKTDE